MFQQTSYTDQISLFQKFKSLDFVLLSCFILLGIISGFSMYSTDGGELLYHSKSHIIRFIIFVVNLDVDMMQKNSRVASKDIHSKIIILHH